MRMLLDRLHRVFRPERRVLQKLELVEVHARRVGLIKVCEACQWFAGASDPQSGICLLAAQHVHRLDYCDDFKAVGGERG